MALIGLDVGGSGVKAVAFSDNGTILATAYREYDMITPAPGLYEYDPRAIRAASKEVLKEAAAQCTEDVLGIGASSFGESYAILDENDEVLANTMMYLDLRGQEYLDEMNSRNDLYEFRMRQGTRPRINHSVIKLHVFSHEHPEVFQKAKKILFMADFVLYMLGGDHVTDYSIAATTGGFDVRKMEWRKDFFAWAGVDPDLLPGVVPPGSCVGQLSEKAADELGLKAGINLVIGGLDHIPSSVGCGVIRQGQLMNAIGTVDCYTLLTGNIDPNFRSGDFLNLPYYTDGIYGALIANMAGGVLLKWFREHLGRYEKEMWKDDGLDFYAEYEKRMAKEPTDLFVLPRFAGYADRLDARAGILNMTLSTTNEELYRAFMEGATYEMYSMLREFGAGIDSVTAVGGGANCDTYMQIRADVFDLPIYTVNSTQPGALGDAMLAGISAGVFRDIPEAVSCCVQRKREFLPDPKRHEYYQGMYERYLKIYDLLGQA